MMVSAGGIRRTGVGAYPFRKTGAHFSGICAYIVLFLALSFVPASAAGKPTAAAATEPSPPRTWEYCYQLSRKLGWDHEADEWSKFVQDCMAGGDVASYAK